MRDSPGSMRNITSPRLRLSHRHLSDFTMIGDMYLPRSKVLLPSSIDDWHSVPHRWSTFRTALFSFRQRDELMREHGMYLRPSTGEYKFATAKVLKPDRGAA